MPSNKSTMTDAQVDAAAKKAMATIAPKLAALVKTSATQLTKKAVSKPVSKSSKSSSKKPRRKRVPVKRALMGTRASLFRYNQHYKHFAGGEWCVPFSGEAAKKHRKLGILSAKINKDKLKYMRQLRSKIAKLNKARVESGKPMVSIQEFLLEKL